MAELKHLPDRAVRADHHDEDLRQLIKELRPEWPQQELNFEVLSGGFMNQLYRAFVPSVAKRESLVVRVFNDGGIGAMFDRAKEIIGLIAAHQAGHGTPVHAVFKNGVVLGFCVGRCLEHQDFMDPKFNKLIATAIARLNHIEPEKIVSLPPGFKNTYSKEQNMIDFFADMFAKNEEDKRIKEELNMASKEELLKEYNGLLSFLKSLDAPLVFCHGDIHKRNLMYDEENNNIIFVDFEAASYGFIHTDVCRFFQLKPYTYLINFSTQEESEEPVDDVMFREYIRTYLETKAELEGRLDREPVTDDDITTFTCLAEIANIISLFESYVGCLLTPMEALDNIGIGKLCKEKYDSTKHKLQELGEKYMELRKQP